LFEFIVGVGVGVGVAVSIVCRKQLMENVDEADDAE
jgi:predicted small secreted protein